MLVVTKILVYKEEPNASYGQVIFFFSVFKPIDLFPLLLKSACSVSQNLYFCCFEQKLSEDVDR